MALFAVIVNGLVENIIVAENKEVAETVTGKFCEEYTDENPAGINWEYDGVNFIAPAIQESDDLRIITQGE
jgi:hypothetical protein